MYEGEWVFAAIVIFAITMTWFLSSRSTHLYIYTPEPEEKHDTTKSKTTAHLPYVPSTLEDDAPAKHNVVMEQDMCNQMIGKIK